MKIGGFLAATALTVASFAPFAAAPALANPPIQDTTGLSAQDVCDNQLKPDYSSDFQTQPQNVSVGDWVTTSTDLGDAIGDPYGVGTPVYSDIFLTSGFYRNGGSPNVWGGATATVTYPQTGQRYETTLNQQRTTTFDCYVSKIVGHNDTVVDPAGLQSTGNTSVEQQQIAGEPQVVVTDADFVVSGETVNALICISPNNSTKGKPGTWVQKHGFTGSCTAASTAAGTGFIPSNNAPFVD